MRNELRYRPVEMARVAERQSLWRKALRRKIGREQQHLELDIEGARRLVRRLEEVGLRRRISRGPARLRRAEGGQGFRRDHPGRDGGKKALAEEGSERLIFPPLNIARRPIVEQAKSGDVVSRLGNGDRRAERVAGSDPNAQLELVVETARRPEARSRLGC